MAEAWLGRGGPRILAWTEVLAARAATDPAGRQFLKTGSMALEEWNKIGVASAMKMQQ